MNIQTESHIAKKIASCDFYRSIPPDLHSKTKKGGVITLVAFFVIAILLVTEAELFLEEQAYSLIFVSRIKGNDRINIHINMTVLDYQCGNIYLWFRTKRSGYVIGHVDQKDLQLEDNEGGCMITGATWVSKVPGFFEVTIRKAGSKNITLAHSIDQFALGDNFAHVDGMIWDQHIPEQTFNALHGEGISSNFNKGYDTEYHLQLVQSKVNLFGYWEYPYQYVYNKKTAYTMDIYPGIKFYLDWSPLTIEYGIKNYSWLDITSRSIAIIGGIFTLALFLHGLLSNTTETLYEKTFQHIGTTKLGA